MTDPIDLRSLEALRRDLEAPVPDGARARVTARLAPFLPASAPASREGPSSSMVVRGLPSKGLLALAFALGGGVGALLHAALVPKPAPLRVYIERPASSAPSAESPPLSQPPPESARMATATVSTSPTSEGRAAARPTISQLDAERALLDVARAALVGGEIDVAIAALDRHIHTYARPMLGEERDALFIQTLVRAGRYDEARTRAEAFRRSAPTSLFLPAVETAIASIP
jgi:hypothetical protein